MKKHYKTIIYGSSMFALGFALENQEDTLIIEPTTSVAKEYTATLWMSREKLIESHKVEVLQLKKELEDRYLLRNDRIYCQAIVPTLMGWIQRNRIKILFSAVVLNTKQDSNNVSVKIMFQHEQESLTCQQFIDTTIMMNIPSKCNALIQTEDKSYIEISNVKKSIYPDIFIYSIKTETNERAIDCRKRIMEKVNKDAQFYSIKLLHIADIFAFPSDRVLISESSHLVSAPAVSLESLFEPLLYGMEYGGGQ